MNINKNRISKTKVSLLTLFLSCLFASAGTFAFLKFKSQTQPESSPVKEIECTDKMFQTRLKNYKYIQPLVLTDLNSESASLKSIRFKLQKYIDEITKKQNISQVSVYFRKLNDGSWFNINPNQTYNPGGLNKVIYLISILKEQQANPFFLNKQIYFKHHFDEAEKSKFNNFVLKEYSIYTVRDLLSFMIKYSDNDAAILLTQHMNLDFYWQLFKDLDEICPIDYSNYSITASEFSKFFRILYNASYLTPDLSEYGLGLLAKTDFKEGLCAGIDSTITISHKYGERIFGNEVQLHDFGIIYNNDDPYLLSVMTKGSSRQELTTIIKEISRLTFLEIKKLQSS